MDLHHYFARNALDAGRPIINNLGIETSLPATSGGFVDIAMARPRTFAQKTWSQVKGITRFAITTLLIFGVIQVAINFPAYKQQYEFFREKQLSIKNPQKELLKSLQKLPAADATLSNTQVAEAASSNTVAESFSTRQEVINYNNFEVAPSDNRVVIGKIGKNVPIVSMSEDKLISGDYKGLEKDIQSSLQEGIVHYPGTASPGEIGNVFLTGHSSNYAWAKGDYNDVLALANELVVGDRVTIYWEGKKYIYQVYDRMEVAPSETSVLKQSGNAYPSIMTLMTCTPVGTALRRLIVHSKQIYPEPALNTEPTDSIIATPQSLISS